MQVRVVNQHAQGRYENLRAAIEMVRLALDELVLLHRKLGDHSDTGFAGWRVPSKEEVVAAHTKAIEQLNVVRESAKKWEKELVSKGWRI